MTLPALELLDSMVAVAPLLMVPNARLASADAEIGVSMVALLDVLALACANAALPTANRTNAKIAVNLVFMIALVKSLVELINRRIPKCP
jgi:hypothetical protein